MARRAPLHAKKRPADAGPISRQEFEDALADVGRQLEEITSARMALVAFAYWLARQLAEG